jgi:hypothetical protein
MENKIDYCTLDFFFIKDLEKSIMVKKGRSQKNKVYFVPFSIIKSKEKYVFEKRISCGKDCNSYTYDDKIKVVIPTWFAKKNGLSSEEEIKARWEVKDKLIMQRLGLDLETKK